MDCPVCQRGDREAVDAALRARGPLVAVAVRFGFNVVEMARHKTHADLKPRPVEELPAATAPEVGGDPEEGPEYGPALPKNRAAAFQAMSARAYHQLWTLYPTRIARALTPQERHYPEWNPLHPNAEGLPPEARRRMRRAGPVGGARLDPRQEGEDARRY